ncbi:MAG: hypothetical protein MJ138_06610 [Kiritimatiellae bacterium]|nr:hypothetical protein [Kiritimatiellia bacterium]
MKRTVLLVPLALAGSAFASISYAPDKNGDPVATIKNASGECRVALRGAQVTACRFAGDEHPLLFAPKAGFDSRPVGDEFVHGGVPLLWPWFGSSGAPVPPKPTWWERRKIAWGWMDPPPREAPFHATARRGLFAVAGEKDGADETTLALKLTPDDFSRKWFPHDFELRYEITLAPHALTLRLVTRNLNKDGRAFGYGVGYHPYLRTSNCFNTWLEGFDGATYESTRDLPCDAAGGNVWRGKLPVWPGCDLFKMPGEGSAVALVDPAWSRRITIRTTGGSDVVTWIQNKSLEHVFNVDRSEINDYVCVEPANFYPDRWPTVPAGGEHAFQTVIAAEPLK